MNLSLKRRHKITNTIIFGAPGCGKTYYLLNLLDDLLKTYRPEDIAFVSFTRKGAYEGRDRAIERFGFSKEEFPYFRTLHSIGFLDAELSREDVISKDNYRNFSRAVGMKFTGYYTEDFNSSDDKYLFHYFLKKSNVKAAKLHEDNLDMYKYEFIERNYLRFKNEMGVLDYTDMLTMFIDRQNPLPVKVAIIDEAQDLTTLQWKMCEVAFKDCDHVYIAGDDDQAIYQWNGADIDYFLDLPGERIILDQSYRMRSELLSFSSKIAQMITKRVDKQFKAIEEGGQILTHNSINEIQIKKDETYYFLSRNNFFLGRYKELLSKYGMVYNDKTTSSISPRLIRAIIAYEKHRETGKYDNPVDELIVDQYSRKDVSNKRPWFDKFNLDIEEANYYRNLIANKADMSNNKLTVNTIHGVKGGEADNVVVQLDFTRSVKKSFIQVPDSELRCLYVACTRAKKRLHIVYSSSSNGYDNFIDFNRMLT